MDIHIWVPRDPWGGSMDTLGGPMGPWDRWDLGTDGTWASRTPDTSSEDTSSELFIDTWPGPARPGQPSLCRLLGLVLAAGCRKKTKTKHDHNTFARLRASAVTEYR